MQSLSVVIIARNSSTPIAKAIESAMQFTDDVIVVDSGSTDNTIQIARGLNAKVINIEWAGFGAARNLGAASAKNDWIFSLDTDELISEQLAAAVTASNLDEKFIYGFKRTNLVGDQVITYGQWGHDKVYRVYHKKHASWNLDAVHEVIESTSNKKKMLDGKLIHYTISDLKAYSVKLDSYAELSAQKFASQEKNSGFIKSYISPGFSFIKNYLFRLGFLDGKAGLKLALLHARYTFLKYKKLKELHREGETREATRETQNARR